MFDSFILLLLFFGAAAILLLIATAVVCVCSKEAREGFINDWNGGRK